MEKILVKDILATRIHEYLPPSEILEIKPSPVDFKERDEYRKFRPGDDFSLVIYENKLVIVPSWHPLNRIPKSANSVVSATGSIETLSLEPVLANSQAKEIQTANIVLIDPRMERLYTRSLPNREIDFPIPKEEFKRGIIDLMSVQSTRILAREDGTFGFGSIRVTVALGMGKFGKSAFRQKIEASVESCRGSKPLPERGYNGEGLIVSAGPNQRFEEFRGKHSSHYGDAGRIGAISKELGADEAILFAPYYAYDANHIDYLARYKNNPGSLEDAILNMALANGLGAELLAVRKDGTILLPPFDVNRLKGATAEYIMQELAPDLGIPVDEAVFSLQDVLDGEITGLFFAGNAARIAAIGKVRLHDERGNVLRDINLEIPDAVTALIEKFENQVGGLESPSHPSLVTNIDLKDGEEARKVLMKEFAEWMD